MKKLVLLFASLFSLLTGFAQQPSQNFDINGNSIRTTNSPISPNYQTPLAGNEWHSIGPFGGDILDITANPLNPDMLFAVGGQPYVSNNGGNTWTLHTGLSTLSGGAVNAIEAASNGVIIATGPNGAGKIYRSADGGSTWQTRNLPVNTSGLCVAIAPSDNNIVYAGLVSNLAASTNKVLVKSSDGGLNWTAIDMTTWLPVGTNVADVCIDPLNSQTIYVIGRSGFSNAMVVASFDGGTNWEDRTNNLPFGKPYNKIAIAGHKVFVAGGQLFGTQNVGVYQSTDWGLSWTNISASFPNKVSNTLLINPADTNNIFVGTEGDGIYVTTDGGATWNYNTAGAGNNGAARALILKPGTTDVLYAGFLSIAVCKSTDAGLNWVYANNGIATLNINDIEVDRTNPARLILGFEAENSGGCYLSSDTGANWTLVSGLPGTRYSKVGFGADGYMYAWSNGPSTIGQEGLYKSMDNGLTWYNMGPNIGSAFETEIWSLAASENNPGLIFVGGNNFGNNGWESMIYKTTDAGQTWTNVYKGTQPDNFESFRYLYIEPGSDDQVIYACYKSEVAGGILKSSDGGTNWSPISDGIPGPEKWFGSITSDTTGNGRLLVGTGGYGSNGRIYVSNDGGNNWSPTSMNLGAYSRITDMVLNPQHPEIVYAATSQNGPYVSTNGGLNWQTANNGMPTLQISAFSNAFHAGTGWGLIASTYSNSAFRTTLISPAAGIDEDSALKANIRVYPNPCNGLINIDYSAVKGKIEKIEILDACGKVFSRYGDISDRTFGLLQLEIPAGLSFCRVFTQQGCCSFKIATIKP